MKPHYTPEEANAILEKALRNKPLPGDMSREQLIKLAEEVGVTPEELDAAERTLRVDPKPDRLRAEYLEYRSRKLSFLRVGIVLWLFVILGLTAKASGTGVGRGHILLFICVAVFVIVLSFVKDRSGISEWRFQRWLRRRERMASLNLPCFLRRFR